MTRHRVFDVGHRTDIGRVRTHNEDSFAIREPSDPVMLEQRGRVYLVADGMGGHLAGDVASTAAARIVLDSYYGSSTTGDPERGLATAIQTANERIRDLATKPGQEGMGTTLVVAVVHDDRLVIANIGDSRCYLFRNGRIRQLSRDHSWVAEAVETGFLTPEQAAVHPRRNAITRSVGTRPEVKADFFSERWEPGDVVVLCSDGLTGPVTDEEIAQTLRYRSAQTAADRLVALANARGGPDNITVVVIRNGPAPIRRFLRPAILASSAAAAALVALIGLSGVPGGGASQFATVASPVAAAAPEATRVNMLPYPAPATTGRVPTSTPATEATSTPRATATLPPRETAIAVPTTASTGPVIVSAPPATAPPTTAPPATATAAAPATATPPATPTLFPTPSFFAPTNTPRPATPTPRPGDDGGGGGNVDRR